MLRIGRPFVRHETMPCEQPKHQISDICWYVTCSCQACNRRKYSNSNNWELIPITNLCFLIIKGIANATKRAITEPFSVLTETAIQNVNPGERALSSWMDFSVPPHLVMFFLPLWLPMYFQKFIPVYHQGKITCHRIHLLSQCLCATYLASGNSRPYRKRRIYACSRGKALVSNPPHYLYRKLYLICMLQIGIAYLKHAFLSVIGIHYCIMPSHLSGENKRSSASFFSCCPSADSPAGHPPYFQIHPLDIKSMERHFCCFFRYFFLWWHILPRHFYRSQIFVSPLFDSSFTETAHPDHKIWLYNARFSRK